MRLILDRVAVRSDVVRAEPGSIVASESEQLWVATGEGVLVIERLQPAGKRAMDASEFLRGHPMTDGVWLE